VKWSVFCAVVAAGSLLWGAHGHVQRSEEFNRVMFERFPLDDHLYREDVSPLIDQIIARHGQQEWETVVLTSEFHTHLGIYAIVGAKMGLRARDHFGAGLDEVTVRSFAGRKPPVSCLNDGLQASTGATLGHGTISAADTAAPRPKAQFSHDDATISLELKDAYWRQVRKDIAGIIDQHGLASEAYWASVRSLGIRYWLEWSRRDIFDLQVVESGHGT
jgi:pyrimidine-specific ribonucleoside hydrolase